MTIIHEKLKQRKTENYALKYAKFRIIIHSLSAFYIYTQYEIVDLKICCHQKLSEQNTTLQSQSIFPEQEF